MYSSITMTTPIADSAAALMLTHLSLDGDRFGSADRGARRRRRFQRHSKLLKHLA